MPQYLLLNADNEFPQEWCLADHVDPKALEAEILSGMEHGEVVAVPILVSRSNQKWPCRLFLHGAKVASAAVLVLEPSPQGRFKPYRESHKWHPLLSE